MNTIAKPRDTVSTLWGEPKPKDTEYRLLRYTLRSECEDGTLLHNVVTGQLVLLSGAESELLDTLPRQYSAEMDALIAAHFLVPTDFDEERSYHQLRTLLRKLDRSDAYTSFTVLPTLACNARCFYCYEADYPKISMSPETAEKVVDYIAAHCGRKKCVSVGWFGGEPLLGAERIRQITDGLKEREIEFSSTMISNGYLFTPELAKTAKEDWRLKSIQITLDGTRDMYNRVKAYVGASDDPYYRVLDNIGELLKNDIRVTVRMNLDRHNADDLYRLAEELAERFSGEKLFSAYSHVLFDDCGYETVRHTDEDKRELIRVQLDLDAYLKKLGLYGSRSGLPSLRTNACMADNLHSLVINPMGEFGVCEHYCTEHLIGSLETGVQDTEERSRWLRERKLALCETCPLRPCCFKSALCPGDECSLPEADNKIGLYRKRMRDVYEKKRTDDETGDEEPCS